MSSIPPEEPPPGYIQKAEEYTVGSASEFRKLLRAPPVGGKTVGAYTEGVMGASVEGEDLVRQLLRDRQMDRIRSLVSFVRDLLVIGCVIWFTARLNSYLESSTLTEMTDKAVRIMANGEGASAYIVQGARDLQISSSQLATRVNQTGSEVQVAVRALTLALNRLSRAGLNVLIPSDA